VKFQDKATEDILHGDDTDRARRLLLRGLHQKAGELLDRLNAAVSVRDLSVPRANRLEKLSGERNDNGACGSTIAIGFVLSGKARKL